MTRFRIFVLLLTFLTTAGAAELKVGEALPSLTFEDQNGKSHTLDGSLRFLVFAPNRASSQLVTAAFEGQTAASLQSRGIAYLADVSGMPSPIASMFALPKMRKQPYPILLGRKAADTAAFPRQANHAVVLVSKDGKLIAIMFFSNAAELHKALGFDVKQSGSPQNFPLAPARPGKSHGLLNKNAIYPWRTARYSF